MLSIAITSRNDNHGGNLVYRTQVYLDMLIEYWRRYNWSMELLYVEWNPVPKIPMLWELLKWPDDFPIKIYVVPNEIHRCIPNAHHIPIFVPIGQNFVSRQAKGEWFVTSSSDVIYHPEFAQILANEDFSPDSYYRVVRVDCGNAKTPQSSIDGWVAFCQDNVVRVNEFKGGLFTRACGDFIMMTTDKWRELRGYPEWPILGWHLDGVMVHMAYYAKLKQVILPHAIYHVAHSDRGVDIYKDYPNLSTRGYKNLCKRMTQSNSPIIVNDENWGLAPCVLEQADENKWTVRGTHVPRTAEGIPT